MGTHVCPWWMAYSFDNPLRRLIHNPAKMFKDYVKTGNTALDLGCGMGFFSIGIAKIVGDSGRVISLDLQNKMLEVMQKRAKRAGVESRITPHQCKPDSIDFKEPVDFVLAFWMVHEVPDQKHFLTEVRQCLKPDSHFYVAEPKGHVTSEAFEKMLATAEEVGLKSIITENGFFSRTAVLRPV